MPSRKPSTSASGSAAQRAPSAHRLLGVSGAQKQAAIPSPATAWEMTVGMADLRTVPSPATISVLFLGDRPMKPALLAVVSLAALAAAASPPARAAGECVEASELSLNGVPLRTSRRDVLQRLGRPVGEWKERLDRHLDHLVYPGLDVRIREDGSVESLLARSARYSLPSGVRVGLPWKEVWAKQGLRGDVDARRGRFVTIPLCGGFYGTVFLQFGFGRDLRLVRIEIGVSPSADDAPSLAEEREEANGEPFPWSKGPLEYIAMLRKHRRRIHKVDDKAPAGWVKESDLPALVPLLQGGRP